MVDKYGSNTTSKERFSERNVPCMVDLKVSFMLHHYLIHAHIVHEGNCIGKFHRYKTTIFVQVASARSLEV